MHSNIRIGLFTLFTSFLLASFGLSAQTRPNPLPPLDSLDLHAMQSISGELFGMAGNLEASFKELDEKAKEGLLYSQTRLKEAKADSTVLKFEVDSLSKEVKNAKSLATKRAQQLERSKKAASLAGSLTEMTDSLLLRKNLPKAWQQISQLHAELYSPVPTEMSENKAVTEKQPILKKDKTKKESPTDASNPNSEPATDQPATNQPISQNKRFAQYNPAKDVMLSPPTPPCRIASSSRDEFSGEISRELARAELFRYTNPVLKTYLQGKTHIICEAALTSSGPNATLILTFNINDPNARKAFGRLEKNSIASLKFLDGSMLELQNAIADDGVFSLENDASIFRGQYPLTPEILKKLRHTGLDKVRILWSKGYDDYDVQQVDILMRQAECLFK